MNNDPQPCLFCGITSDHNKILTEDDKSVVEETYDCCENHGCYIIRFKRGPDEDAIKKLIEDYKVQLSGYLYEIHQHETDDNRINTELDQDSILKIVNDSRIPKTQMQKLDKILLSIYRQDNGFNSFIKYYPPAIGSTEKIIFPIYLAYAKDDEELKMMFEALCELGYLKKEEKRQRYTISYKGLEYAESLLSSNKNSDKVFVAMKFEEDMFKVLEDAVKPACSECGFDAYTVNEKEHNNDITDEIVAGLKTSRFVIADFTYNNRGVYFEAGYAQGKGVEVIRTCKKEYYDKYVNGENTEHKLHFDINHYNFILWENEEDLRKQLVNRIRATIL